MFLSVLTVDDALRALHTARRTPIRAVPPALGVVPAEPVAAEAWLPPAARATVDGYAVRAIDTYGASETLPSFLELTGAVVMGAAPAQEVGPGAAVAIPTGGLLPHGADAVVMVEHTTEPMPGHVELLRPVAPGEGVLHAGEEARPGDELVPAGRPLRAADLGLLAAAGVTEVRAHARPHVGILSTGDEVVPPSTAEPGPAQVRDACAPALAGLVREAGGEPRLRGIVPDDAAALEHALQAAVAEDDVVVVSAGSSVGARDLTATVVARLGEVVCHGLADQAGEADAARRLRRRAARRPAGQPALGARRLPARRRPARAARRRHHGPAAGCRPSPPASTATCRARRGGSTSCRRACTTASPRRSSAPRRCSARWCAPTAGSGSRRRPRASAAGTGIEVTLYG